LPQIKASKRPSVLVVYKVRLGSPSSTAVTSCLMPASLPPPPLPPSPHSQDGHPLNLTKVAAGSTLSGLELRVLNQQQEEVEVDASWLKGKNLGLRVGWVGGKLNSDFPR
jgi:hypothetical protein